VLAQNIGVFVKETCHFPPAEFIAGDENSLLASYPAFPGKVRGTADPSASLGMTKERATVHKE
jgi:hypothetical protein